MKRIRVATIALSNRDFDSFEDKLTEAAHWVELSARLGAELAVLPETITNYRGDGVGHSKPLSTEEMALSDWETACQTLLKRARDFNIAVTVPVHIEEQGTLYNASWLVDETGNVLGRYIKRHPTASELEAGIKPGAEPPITWRGIKLGGAICFDMNFTDVYTEQVRQGVELFLCPSLFPGGDQVNYMAARLETPFVLAYPAWSRIVDKLGRDIVAGGYRHETLRFGFGVPVYVADLNLDSAVFHFDHNQERIEDILFRHGQNVGIEFDQANVRFLLESRSPDLTIQDLIDEFDLVPQKTYLQQNCQSLW